MSDGTAADINARASELVQKVSREQCPVSNADTALLVSAVAEDLGAQAQKATLDEERLTKVETQTRVLADAVVAMTDTVIAVGIAVQAVKDEM